MGLHHDPLIIDPAFFGEDEDEEEILELPPHDYSLDHVEEVDLTLTETGELDLDALKT